VCAQFAPSCLASAVLAAGRGGRDGASSPTDVAAAAAVLRRMGSQRVFLVGASFGGAARAFLRTPTADRGSR
jgi:pimeloyl-ACP methyl ester carboxylesterase